ncbi:MBL fold metallo-hydrolase [Alteromonas halophila]|uniref:MBL fold hydrolase n=1 Tax=Alteromonas halophila TaxID=516698 RepID=A0A918JEG6_9ALTE|nr:MBL fold metallo-hydrolase [Alteromonas halophila]GGW76683.1 MBL fold hydrolase [Alteromonas halophila]
MFVETIKTPGIAHLSYIIGNDGEACVIDPQLDTDTYLKLANQHGCRITTVIETHRNEDFISGAKALGQRTQANIYHGPNADEPVSYAQTITEGEQLSVGAWCLEVIETPGHTKDSICVTATDTNASDEVIGVFTGDTLFVSDVGRTDFYPDEKEAMAASLYQSLGKLSALGEQVIVYPAHGAGSVCGGGMADREFTTIGIEQRSNPMLRIADEAAFVAKKVSEYHYIAPYFSRMEAANVSGVAEAMPAQLCAPLLADEQTQWLDTKKRPGMLIDVRSHAAFREQHIAGSINLPGDLLSAYGGWLLDDDTPLALVADHAAQANEAARQLWRMGVTQVAGYVSTIPAALTEQHKRAQSVATVTADTISNRLSNPAKQWVLLDVRKRDEVVSTPFPGALHTFLGHLKDYAAKTHADTHYTCMCGSGARATVAASYLQMLGCNNVDVFEGSLDAWQQASHEVS